MTEITFSPHVDVLSYQMMIQKAIVENSDDTLTHIHGFKRTMSHSEMTIADPNKTFVLIRILETEEL